MTPLPCVVFAVRPERGARWRVVVEVYSTQADLTAVSRIDGALSVPRRRVRGGRLYGECLGITERVRGRRTPTVALVRLCAPHLGIATVTHEAFHATCRWAERRGYPLMPTDGRDGSWLEERLASVHDECTRRIYNELIDRGLVGTAVPSGL